MAPAAERLSSTQEGSMSERWKPRQVHRMVTPEARAAAQERERERRERLIDEHQRRQRVLAGNAARPIECTHGVAWTACTLCSRPVQR